MIVVHRLTPPGEPLHLNPDLIQTLEAHPDTVICLTNGSRLVVRESPDEVAASIRAWRAGVLVEALGSPAVCDSVTSLLARAG